MSLFKLAWINFKGSIRSWMMLIVSLSFTLMVMDNLINIIDSDLLVTSSEYTQKMVNTILIVITVILAIFLIFYISYSTGIFFQKQKKELGMYVFMGFSMKKIASLCLIEILFIGLAALVIGNLAAALFSRLFLMLISALSGIDLSYGLTISLNSVLIGSLIFWLIYLFFAFVRFIGVCRSSVIDLLNAGRASEKKPFRPVIMTLEALLGVILMGIGFVLSVSPSDNLFQVLVPIVLLVCAGTYLLFAGMIPLCLNLLQKNKSFLYQEQRNLWINSLIFRMSQNYRTYAVTAILLMSSLSALACGLAIQQRKQQIDYASSLYPVEALAQQAGLQDQLAEQLSQISPAEIEMIVEIKNIVNPETGTSQPVISQSEFSDLAAKGKFEDPFLKNPLEENQYASLSNLYLMSFRTDHQKKPVEINGHQLNQAMSLDTPVFGSLSLNMGALIVPDSVFNSIDSEQSLFLYGFEIQDPALAMQAAEHLAQNKSGMPVEVFYSDPEEYAFISVTYAISYFVFGVFVLSACCILSLRVFADASDERERIRILKRLGIRKHVLSSAARREVALPYILTYIITLISSFFVIACLSNTMSGNLLPVHLAGMGAILIILLLFCIGSIRSYQKNSGILGGLS